MRTNRRFTQHTPSVPANPARPSAFRRTVTCFAVVMALSCVLVVTARTDVPPPPPVPTVTVLAAATDIGLTPEAVVDANLQQSVGSILSKLQDATELRQMLKAQQVQLDAAVANLSASNQALSDGTATDEMVAQHEVLVAALETAEASLAQTRASLRSAALDGVAPETVAILDNVAASAGSSVPTEFRIKAKTAEEWKAVQGALRAEARAERRGTALSPEQAALLASLRGDVAVIAAKNRLAADLSTVQAAFAAAANPE